MRLLQHPPDRATVKRKWSADKSCGPLILMAEWQQKRLIQHAYPCRYDVTDDECVIFKPDRNRPPFTAAFWDAFDSVLRILCQEKKVNAYRIDTEMYLDGVYHINKYGVIRPGENPCPF